MKRTPLKRSKPLGRTRMRPGKRKSKYALRDRDCPYMNFVKNLPCLLSMWGCGECSGVVEADHAGLDSGMGHKAPDRTCIPLCSGHHLDRHAATGYFRDMDRAERREWRLWAIAKTQAEHEAAEFFHRNQELEF